MTRPRIDPSLTVNEILQRHPAAVTVINAYGIDSCCGGGIPLEAAAREQQLDLDAIRTELDALIAAEAR